MQIKIGIKSHSRSHIEEYRLKMNNSRLVVCSPRQCTTIVSLHLVRGSAQIPKDKHVPTDIGSRTNRVYVFHAQSHVHAQSEFDQGVIFEKSIRQVRLSLSFLRYVFRYVHHLCMQYL